MRPETEETAKGRRVAWTFGGRRAVTAAVDAAAELAAFDNSACAVTSATESRSSTPLMLFVRRSL